MSYPVVLKIESVFVSKYFTPWATPPEKGLEATHSLHAVVHRW